MKNKKLSFKERIFEFVNTIRIKRTVRQFKRLVKHIDRFERKYCYPKDIDNIPKGMKGWWR